MLKIITLGVGLLAAASVWSADSDLEAKLEAAMNADSRPVADVARDRNRKPLQTLEFFGLQSDMSVIELMPGGGWYTRLLAPVLKEKGKLHVAIGTGRVETRLLGSAEFAKSFVVTAKDAKTNRPKGSRFYELEASSLDVENADMVLTFRNYHNFGDAARAKVNDMAFAALKKGGIYGVVDHTRRHMAPNDTENRRRFDAVKAIKEIQAAGFEFVDFSTLHYRPDDELRYEVGRKSVTGNTDRWTLKFRKP
jgi:predicted methyltransferase